MLIVYSIFVLISVGIKYCIFFIMVLEIFVYIWNVGDVFEEIVVCIVSFKIGVILIMFFICNDYFILFMFCSYEWNKFFCS